MRRTIPLFVTMVTGFVLIGSHFVPATVSWGEVVAIWFNILAAIAFVLGAGNLFKINLKTISDRKAGWGYAVVTLVSFVITIGVGLLKVGVPSAPEQSLYGEVMAELPLNDWPLAPVEIEVEYPVDPAENPFPLSIRAQVEVVGENRLALRGWLTDKQVTELKEWSPELKWQCAIERAEKELKPPNGKQFGKIVYRSDHQALFFRGTMSEAQQTALRELPPEEAATENWNRAIDELAQASRQEFSHTFESMPEGFRLPAEIEPPGEDDPVPQVRRGETPKQLIFTGPIRPALEAKLVATNVFPRVLPMTPERRATFLSELIDRGELTEAQREAMSVFFDGVWTPQLLMNELQLPKAQPELKACELLEKAGGEGAVFEDKGERPERDYEIPELAELPALIDSSDDRSTPLRKKIGEYIDAQPTEAEFKRNLAFALLREGPLTSEQKEYLFADYRARAAWVQELDRFAYETQQEKYPWAGDYDQQGAAFWWIYEYVFKPLTATMFALLAFYVASAAFRAFRAKNFEALLLLGTAFIILLGQTSAGDFLTGWLPESLAFLKFDSLSRFIMQVFNIAGNRAIMIGIALGIASTSLKVLLGIDRSYLGGGDD